MKRALPVLCLATLLAPGWAYAQGGTIAACVEAHSHGQAERNAGRMLSAKQDFVSCASSGCPTEIQSECIAFLAEVERAQASIVFAAVDAEGHDATDVKVKIDDQLVLDKLTGLGTAVDPGSHTIVYTWPDGFEQTHTLLVAQGEKNRRVELRREPKPAAAPVAAAERPASAKGAPVAAYVLGGIGVLALGSFAGFALAGKSAESDLDGCKPYCSQSQADKMRLRYLIADVSLGVGVVALGVGGYLYFSAEREPRSGALRGGSFGMRGTF